jgi:hypothetical protein
MPSFASNAALNRARARSSGLAGSTAGACPPERSRPGASVAEASGAREPSGHELKKSHTGHIVLAGHIGTDPAREFLHRHASFRRWVGHADLGCVRVLAIRLQYALSESVAEVQPSETGFVSGPGGACIPSSPAVRMLMLIGAGAAFAGLAGAAARVGETQAAIKQKTTIMRIASPLDAGILMQAIRSSQCRA